MELTMSMFATQADYWKARAELAETTVAETAEALGCRPDNEEMLGKVDELRNALAVVVHDWTQQFERNGHLAPAWVKQARVALGEYKSTLVRLTEPDQPTRHQQREAWRTGENGL